MGALGPPFPSLVHLPRPANPCFGGCGRGAWRQEGWGQLLDTHASVHSRIASVRQEWGLEMSLSLEAHLRGSNSVGPGRSLDSSFLTSPIWSVGRRGWGLQFGDTALNPWDLPPSRASSQILGFHLESQPRTGGAIEGPREQRIETQRSGEGWWPQQPPKPEVHRVLCVYGDSPGRPMTDVKHHPIVMG